MMDQHEYESIHTGGFRSLGGFCRRTPSLPLMGGADGVFILVFGVGALFGELGLALSRHGEPDCKLGSKGIDALGPVEGTTGPGGGPFTTVDGHSRDTDVTSCEGKVCGVINSGAVSGGGGVLCGTSGMLPPSLVHGC